MTNVNKRIRKLINREGTAFTNTFDIGRDLINEAFALQEKGDNINYENPMGRKVVNRLPNNETNEILSGDAIDVEIKNTLETFDAKKHKLLLESANIVEDYNAFINCHVTKNIMDRLGFSGAPSYSMYFKYFKDDVINSERNGGSISNIRDMILNEYHQMDDPDKIRQVVQMRIKYIEGVNAILKEMIKTNGQLLGLNEQQIDALIQGLSSNETSGKTVGEIKDIIVANKEKFIKQGGTVLDLRPLGAGVFVGSDDDEDHIIDKNDDKLKTVIQKCLSYDLILNAHGGATYNIDFERASHTLINIRDGLAKDIKDSFPKINDLGKGLTKYTGDINIIAGRILVYLYNNYIANNKPLDYNDDFKHLTYKLFNGGSNNFSDDISFRRYMSKFDAKEQEQIIKKIYLLFKKYLNTLKDFQVKYELRGYTVSNNNKKFDFTYTVHTSKKWSFNIRYLDGKEYTSVKEVIKMAKSKGFDKILINSCNPGELDLPKDLTKNVTFGKHSIFKENYIDYYNESVTENDIYEFLNDFENDYRAIAESYNIDYDNDQVLNEMYNYVTSGQYIAEMSIINEGKLADIWHKIVEFIKKAIGFIIKLVKMFIGWIKGIIDNIKERFGKKKKVKINKSKIKASFISVEGDNASLTSEKEVSSYDELKELINKVMEAIAKIFRKNSDEQVRLQNSLKNECERAANKQSSIGEGYLGLYESTRVKSLINKNSNTMQQITSIIIPISNKVVNKRFNSVGNASVSNTMKKYSKSTNGMLNSNFSDINTIKAEYNLPKDKEVFSKMGKEYQWNEDFSNELDKLTESIKRMPKIKEICSNVTWETHPNKFCICFHIKKQLLDYSNND